MSKIYLIPMLIFCFAYSFCADNSTSPTIAAPASITLTFSVKSVSIYGGTDGMINVGISGGSSPYTYSWSNGEITKNVGGLTAGSYSITVTDGEGNTETGSVEVEQPSESDPGYDEQIINSIGMILKLLEGGSFNMGSTSGQPDETPIHRVNLTSFYMGVYEVTQAQYDSVMGTNPSGSFRHDDHPVENITWYDAAEFCERLSTLEGITYRLPTEAEWEYAAIGGVSGHTYVWGGNSVPVVDGMKQANVADDTFFTNYDEVFDFGEPFSGYDDGYITTSPVGSFEPNVFGLYDMAGNVMEWCSDWYKEYYYRSSLLNNPEGPGTGTGKVMRGGTYGSSTRYLRVHGRFQDTPTLKVPVIGLRCVRELK
ncbi:MAG: SUMF1/EgtB/PvdO family nonheme iron enzyme [bacterium]|nr:SUMF1/EgtB/PvdO family nonheme iron enzyme [bacterium]